MTMTPLRGAVNVAVTVAVATAVAVAALSTTPRISPWSPSEWRITLEVGREPGTDMPKEWGASGARLVLPICVMVESDAAATQDDVLSGGGGGRALRLRPLSDPTFVNAEGQQTVSLGEGGWKIALPPGPPRGHAAKLEFWLDIIEEGIGATRNDVTLPPGRLYLQAPCWRAPELERGARAIRPLADAAEEAQRLLDAQLSHETGDRRLDGVDPLDTVLAYKDMAELVRDRDDKRRRLRDAERVLPRSAESLPLGPWPGDTDPLAVGPGTVAIRRKKLFSDEFCIIGKWRASSVVPLSGAEP